MDSTVPPIAELDAPAAWATVDFISDLHLNVHEPTTFGAWQAYMQGTPADAVFILGDLFEVWVGDDILEGSGDNAHNDRAKSFEYRCACVLREASHHTALFFMHGNRDFLVDQALMSFCHARLLDDPTVLCFLNERWLLSHGDALCLDDTDYMQFRRLVRSSAWQQAFMAQPLAKRQSVAADMRRQSEARKQSETQNYADVDARAASEWLAAARSPMLIHGHTHRPATHTLDHGRARTVLSDWDLGARPPRADVLRLSKTGLSRLNLAEAVQATSHDGHPCEKAAN